ncbi:MAG: transposase domain-containing protein [Bacteroidales bacterium]
MRRRSFIEKCVCLSPKGEFIIFQKNKTAIAFSYSACGSLIGRKNYLFSGNSDAAIRASMFYSLFGSCKAAGINPSEWLEDILSNIYSYIKENRNLEELLPHLWKK